jgi:NAD(P)-dependent dehydrogenase (short-subunit alcohol dehydrogenase family)
MTRLDERVALVTGASRGVGRGVALDEAGCTVYASGRTVADADLPQEVIRAPCDHTDAGAVERLWRASTPSAGGSMCSSTARGAGMRGWWRRAASRGRRRCGSSRAGAGTR